MGVGIAAIETGVLYDTSSEEKSFTGINVKLGTNIQENDSSLIEIALLGGDSYAGLGVKYAKEWENLTLELSGRGSIFWGRNPRFSTTANPEYEMWRENDEEWRRRQTAKEENERLNQERQAAGLPPVPLDEDDDPSAIQAPGPEPEATVVTFEEISARTGLVAAEAKLIRGLTESVALEGALGLEKALWEEGTGAASSFTGALVYTSSSGFKAGAACAYVYDFNSGEDVLVVSLNFAWERAFE